MAARQVVNIGPEANGLNDAVNLQLKTNCRAVGDRRMLPYNAEP